MKINCEVSPTRPHFFEKNKLVKINRIFSEKKRNPEYYSQIQEVLGRNYVLYFDEKKNRMAKPK